MASKARGGQSQTSAVNIANLFEFDTLAREDFLKTYQRRIPLQPEKLLLIAVLKDAIEIFQKLSRARGRRQRALFKGAETWIYDEQADGLFSFNGVCEALELNPSFVRAGLTAWQGQQLKSTAAGNVNKVSDVAAKKISCVRRAAPTRAKNGEAVQRLWA